MGKIKELEKCLKQAQVIAKDYKVLTQKITELFDQYKKEVKPKFEIGKWYKNKSISSILCCFQKLGEYNYGFFGEWVKNKYMEDISLWEEATPEEVSEALIAEAKRRGFKKGVRINGESIDPGFYYDSSPLGDVINWNRKDCYLGIGDREHGFVIFKNGKWAEIIESKPTINGHEIVVGGDVICFGDIIIGILYLKSLYRILIDAGISNSTIKSVTLDDNVTITIEQLKEVVDYINK